MVVRCKTVCWLVVGDAALVWDDFFVVGMLAFAVGHFFYIKVIIAEKNQYLYNLLKIFKI